MSTAPPTIARFEWVTPHIVRAGEVVRVGEQARAATQSLFGRLGAATAGIAETWGVSSPVLSGRHADGSQIRGGDAHALFLPSDENGDGWIDHLTVWAPAGFAPADFRALCLLRQFLMPSRVVRLAPPVFATPDDFAGLPVFGPASVWRTVTPYVPHRGFQKSGRDRDPEELRRDRPGLVRHILSAELEKRMGTHGWPGPAPFELRVVPFPAVSDYVLSRQRVTGGQSRPVPSSHAHGVELRFSRPVTGPLVIGQFCHFGLGLLAALRGSGAAP